MARLIDADKADVEKISCYYGSNCYVEDVQAWLDEQPTVDALPVVHGRWIIVKRHTVSNNPYTDDNYHAHATCSECDFCIHSENASFGYPELNTTKYCPNCGARMDLKEVE